MEKEMRTEERNSQLRNTDLYQYAKDYLEEEHEDDFHELMLSNNIEAFLLDVADLACNYRRELDAQKVEANHEMDVEELARDEVKKLVISMKADY